MVVRVASSSTQKPTVERLPEEVQPSALEALVMRLGCWPLLLTLAHGLLLDQVRYGRTMAQALEVVEHVYQQRGVTAFHLEQVNERYQTVERCLEVSLRHLEEFTLARYQAATRYQELAIFPEDMDIPITLLRIFWQGAGGLEMWETDELCVRLHQLSLLLTCDLGKGIIRLHDVMQYLTVDVSTICVGQAIGFGALLLSAGTKGKRFALPGSTIALLQPLGGAEGQAADIEITAREILRLRRTLYNILAKHTGQSLEEILEKADRGWYLTAKQAVDYGIIDDVLRDKEVTDK